MPWSDILTVIASLFSGFVGGLLIRAFDQKQKKQEAEQERQQERKALLMILDSEIRTNTVLLKIALRGSPDKATHLSTALWDQSQGRLAHLLPYSLIKKLAIYYLVVRVAQPAIPFLDEADETDESYPKGLRKQMDQLISDGYEISQSFQQYVDDPDYVRLQKALADMDGTESAGPPGKVKKPSCDLRSSRLLGIAYMSTAITGSPLPSIRARNGRAGQRARDPLPTVAPCPIPIRTTGLLLR